MNPAAALSGLKAFVQQPEGGDACGLCALKLLGPHAHLFDREREKLECACGPCAMLFSGGTSPRWALVPERAERLAHNPIGEALWSSLGLPIGLAFFVRSSKEGRVVAWYPGPAGATRCQLSFELPQLALAEDVEALLVDRLEHRDAAYRVSLDVAFELVGLIRKNWRGFSGGEGVRNAVAGYLGTLRQAQGERPGDPRA